MQDNSERNRWAVIGFKVTLVAGILFAVLTVLWLGMEVLRNKETFLIEWDPVRNRLYAVRDASIVAFLAYFLVCLWQIVVFVLWEHRSYLNLKKAGIKHRFGTAWTYLSWLVPIANMVLPGLVALDLVAKHKRLIEAVGDGEKMPSLTMSKRYVVWSLVAIVSMFLFMVFVFRPLIDGPNGGGNDTLIVLFAFFGTCFLTIHLSMLKFTQKMGTIEREVFRLWTSGAVEEYLEQRNMRNEPSLSSSADWFSEKEEEFEPQVNFFPDQKTSANN